MAEVAGLPGRVWHRLTTDRKAAVAVVFAIAFAVRLVVGLIVLDPEIVPEGDPPDYLALAAGIARGDGFVGEDLQPTAYRPPGYPAFIAAVWSLTGVGDLAAVTVMDSLVGAVLAAALVLLGGLWFGGRAGLVAGLGAAFYPHLVYYSAARMTEVLFTTLLVLFVLALEAGTRSRSLGLFATSGVLLGAATLTRPLTLTAPVLVAVWSLVRFRSLRAALRCTLVVTVAMLVVVAPWTARNWVALGGFVPVSTNGGVTFWGIHNPVVLTTDLDRPTWRPYHTLPHADELAALDELERDERAYELAFEALRAHTDALPRLVVGKVQRFWSLMPQRSGIEAWIGVFTFTPVLVLAIYGAWLDRRRLATRFPIYLVVAMTAAAAVYTGSIRERLPLEPFLLVYAAMAAVALWDRGLTGKAAAAESAELRMDRSIAL